MTAPAKPIPRAIAARLSYDSATGAFMWRDGKCAGREAGSVAKDGYRHIAFNEDGKFRSVLAHRMAWFIHYGEEPPPQVDHINRNRADNRIENLRAASAADNARNRGPIRNAKYKGVCFDPSGRGASKPWRAYLHVKRRRVEVGRYATAELALEAYKVAAKKFHGEFASWQ